MGITVLGLGAILCAGGAVAHFKGGWKHGESGLVLGGFCCVIAALFMSQAGHF